MVGTHSRLPSLHLLIYREGRAVRREAAIALQQAQELGVLHSRCRAAGPRPGSPQAGSLLPCALAGLRRKLTFLAQGKQGYQEYGKKNTCRLHHFQSSSFPSEWQALHLMIYFPLQSTPTGSNSATCKRTRTLATNTRWAHRLTAALLVVCRRAWTHGGPRAHWFACCGWPACCARRWRLGLGCHFANAMRAHRPLPTPHTTKKHQLEADAVYARLDWIAHKNCQDTEGARCRQC